MKDDTKQVLLIGGGLIAAIVAVKSIFGGDDQPVYANQSGYYPAAGSYQPEDGGSEKTPSAGGAEGTGTSEDTGALIGPAETPVENLYTTIPPEMIPMIGGGDSWYERREISEKLGITPEAYLLRYGEIIGERFGGFGPGIQSHKMTAIDYYAYGYVNTMAGGKRKVEANKLIEESGGSYSGGLLTPPTDYSGSVTDYANWINQQIRQPEPEPITIIPSGPSESSSIDFSSWTSEDYQSATSSERADYRRYLRSRK